MDGKGLYMLNLSCDGHALSMKKVMEEAPQPPQPMLSDDSHRSLSGTERGGVGGEDRALSISFLVYGMPRDLHVVDNETVYDIEPRIRAKGEHIICLRDGRLGAAYVDAVLDPLAGVATMMLSYGWGNQVLEITSALDSYCESTGRDLETALCWICCFCVNQHRVKEKLRMGENISFDSFKAVFGNRVKQTGHIVGLLSPWNEPLYVKRVWCLFEAWTASRMNHVKLDFVLPRQSNESFRDSLEADGLDKVWGALSKIQVAEADAYLPTDKQKILALIHDEGGYAALDKVIRQRLQSWFVQTARLSPGVRDLEAFSPHLCIRIADLLTRLGQNRECAAFLTEQIAKCAVIHVAGLDLAMFHLRLGRTYGTGGDQAGAVSACSKALSICQAARGGDDNVPMKEEAEILRTIASACRKQGNLVESFARYRQAAEIWEYHKKDGVLQTGAAWILINLGITRMNLDDAGQPIPEGAEEALVYFTEAMAVYAAHGKAMSDGNAWAVRNRGVSYLRHGQLDEAAADFSEAERIYFSLGLDGVENFGELCKSQGMLQLQLGNQEIATQYLEHARRILRFTMSGERQAAAALRDLLSLYADREDSVSADQVARTIYAHGLQGTTKGVQAREMRCQAAWAAAMPEGMQADGADEEVSPQRVVEAFRALAGEEMLRRVLVRLGYTPAEVNAVVSQYLLQRGRDSILVGLDDFIQWLFGQGDSSAS